MVAVFVHMDHSVFDQSGVAAVPMSSWAGVLGMKLTSARQPILKSLGAVRADLLAVTKTSMSILMHTGQSCAEQE